MAELSSLLGALFSDLLMHILDKVTEYAHTFQGWEHIWPTIPCKHDGCLMTDSGGVNYAKEQQPVKRTQESGRKKSDDNVRKFFLSANTSVLKAQFPESIHNIFHFSILSSYE